MSRAILGLSEQSTLPTMASPPPSNEDASNTRFFSLRSVRPSEIEDEDVVEDDLDTEEPDDAQSSGFKELPSPPFQHYPLLSRPLVINLWSWSLTGILLFSICTLPILSIALLSAFGRIFLAPA